MPVGEYAVGKALRIACAALLPGWLLLWLLIAVLGSSVDSIHLRPCSARAASSFGSHRHDLHDGCALHLLSCMWPSDARLQSDMSDRM
jgi:hypothetical protein